VSGTQDGRLGEGQLTYLFGQRASIAIGWEPGRKSSSLACLYSRGGNHAMLGRASNEESGRWLRAKVWI